MTIRWVSLALADLEDAGGHIFKNNPEAVEKWSGEFGKPPSFWLSIPTPAERAVYLVRAS
jgi:hypothetical protein